MISIWIRGLLARRRSLLLATALGVAVAVALLASLGVFLASSKASMTKRAASGVTVDWQVQVASGADATAVQDATSAAPGVMAALPVGYAKTTGLKAATGGTTQTTGPGVVLGLPANYQSVFPGEVRSLSGSSKGVLIAQQTASNLHVAPGDTISIGRAGLPAAKVVVDGVVDLPQADSLFQVVGAPPQSQPVAPPDNVVLLPSSTYATVMGPLAKSGQDVLSTQIHVDGSHALSADPAVAFTQATSAARNLEASLAGAGQVGDNLGAVLDSARQDALYAQVLFVFLGIPGAVLAGVLTAALANSGSVRRRRDQALLRTRGTSLRQVVRLAVGESLLIGLLGGAVGLAAAAVVGRVMFGTTSFGATTTAAVVWTVGAFLVGLLVAVGTIAVPAIRDYRLQTVKGARQQVRRHRAPWWMRYGVDVILLLISALVFWITSRKGYTLVLAPEGVPSISVSYWAFAGPALLWIGFGLFTWRLAYVALGSGRRVVTTLVRPITGRLASTTAASMSRQRVSLASGVVLVALALSFATSTATFNSTYRQQAEVDAQLTNGADVTVTESPGTVVSPDAASAIAAVPGAQSVEPIQHRFAYVGTDLQDLYGVQPETIATATSLQDAYFQGGTAQQLLAKLAASPDSVLVSAETVTDFQLQPGDVLNLRLQDGRTKQFTTVPFHYAGIVNEFPTAPHDSFFVANASYVAKATGSDAVGAFLVSTGQNDPATVASDIQEALGPSATVTDISTARGVVGSSLTSVDLSGLTKVELSFALLLAAAAGGLVLALGLSERRRSFAIASVLGATPRQLRSLVFSEGLVVAAGGIIAGAVAGWLLSHMLVAVLTGVFDPPPASLSIPWLYLAVTSLIAAGAIAAAAGLTARRSQRPPVEVLREL